VELSDRAAYEAAVADAGFAFLYRDGPLNWVVEDDRGRQIDVHLVDTSIETIDPGGKRVYGGIPYDVGCFDAVGTIGGMDVRCCTAEFQIESHTGYEIGETDVHDVTPLHRRFGLSLPDIYTDLIDARVARSPFHQEQSRTVHGPHPPTGGGREPIPGPPLVPIDDLDGTLRTGSSYTPNSSACGPDWGATRSRTRVRRTRSCSRLAAR
jgi:Aminoglycoside-2''-adenylyltransferase